MTKNIILLFILICSTTLAWGQTNTEAELMRVQKLLAQTESKSRSGIQKLALTTREIQLTEQSVKSLEKKLKKNRKLEKINKQKLTKLQTETDSLKKEYAELLYYVYKTRSTAEQSMYIFASEDFTQAYNRIKYLQYFTDYNKFLSEKLAENTYSLKKMNDELSFEIQRNTELSEKKADRLALLYARKQVRKQEVKSLSKQKKKLQQELKKKETVSEDISSNVTDQIEKDDKVKPVKKGPKSKLSKDFEKNKKKLPYPMKGVISAWFGVHKHPVLQGVTTRNDGIDITASSDKNVKAVFNGKVSKIVTIPGANKAVIIKHGEYYTVYSNLVSVQVKKNQKVKTGQKIGKVYHNKNKPELSILNFQVWQGRKKLNPYLWLK